VIVRSHHQHLLLVTQPDHAALAAAIMSEWRIGGLAEHPQRDAILFATDEHDNGWREDDERPGVDEQSGRVLDFVNAPLPIRQGIWPRGVLNLTSRPYAAALVAQHALSLYDRYADQPDWRPFLDKMSTLRTEMLAVASPLTLQELRHDYGFVQIGDLASLTFCNGWKKPQQVLGFELRLRGSRLTIAPDPFGGREIPLTIRGRQVPRRPYASGADLQRVIAGAPVIALNGIAVGI
jgi:hypothetical protein